MEQAQASFQLRKSSRGGLGHAVAAVLVEFFWAEVGVDIRAQ